MLAARRTISSTARIYCWISETYCWGSWSFTNDRSVGGAQGARECLRRGPGLRRRGSPVGAVAEIQINAVSVPPGKVPLFEKMLSIKALDDILTVKSGYEEGCRWGSGYCRH